MLHIDIKKWARIVKAGHRITGYLRDETRGAGWEFLYVAVDDHSRLAYTAMYPNEKAVSSIDFLERATAWFQCFGIQVRGVLTDNGPCFYRGQFGGACTALNIRHRRTRPYRPQTNGKAERPSRLLSENGLMLGATKPQPNAPTPAALDTPVQLAPPSC